MSFKKFILASAAVLLLAGCVNNTVPITAITQQGQTLKGTSTIKETFHGIVHGNERSFSMASGNFSCSGSAFQEGVIPPNNIPVNCSDSRKGVAVFDFNGSREDRYNDDQGHGTITLQDGSTAQFVTGDAASAF